MQAKGRPSKLLLFLLLNLSVLFLFFNASRMETQIMSHTVHIDNGQHTAQQRNSQPGTLSNTRSSGGSNSSNINIVNTSNNSSVQIKTEIENHVYININTEIKTNFEVRADENDQREDASINISTVPEESNADEENVPDTHTTKDLKETIILETDEINLIDPKFIEYTVPVLYSSPGEERLNIEEFDELMQSREKLLQTNCRTLQKVQGGAHRPQPFVNSQAFYSLPGAKFSWCPVFKAASTNWMHNLLHLAGLKQKYISVIEKRHPNQPNDQGREVAPVLSKSRLKVIEKMKNSFRLLIVRHPFDRLVSAFRDKLERWHGKGEGTLETNWYYTNYGKKIVSKYRNRAIQRYSKEYFSKANNYGSPVSVQNSWRTDELPMWWEFVQYLIDTPPQRYDEHWKPVMLYCTPCSFNFNYILHFENMREEEKHLVERLDMTGVIQEKWENRNDEGFSKQDLVGKYFSLLDESEILKLYQIYKNDFVLFGYQFVFRGLRLN